MPSKQGSRNGTKGKPAVKAQAKKTKTISEKKKSVGKKTSTKKKAAASVPKKKVAGTKKKAKTETSKFSSYCPDVSQC